MSDGSQGGGACGSVGVWESGVKEGRRREVLGGGGKRRGESSEGEGEKRGESSEGEGGKRG